MTCPVCRGLGYRLRERVSPGHADVLGSVVVERQPCPLGCSLRTRRTETARPAAESGGAP
jgi:hypothetical protein